MRSPGKGWERTWAEAREIRGEAPGSMSTEATPASHTPSRRVVRCGYCASGDSPCPNVADKWSRVPSSDCCWSVLLCISVFFRFLSPLFSDVWFLLLRFLHDFMCGSKKSRGGCVDRVISRREHPSAEAVAGLFLGAVGGNERAGMGASSQHARSSRTFRPRLDYL